MTLLLKLTSLRYAYGERLAVRDISFEIKSGQVFGLLGPNGAGKTTTLSCISGALSKWSGSISMNGNPFFPAREAKYRGLLGIVPQELAVYDTLTARENLILIAKLCGVPRDSVLLGKFFFVFVLGLAQMVVMFVYGELMFHVGLFRDLLSLTAIVITWTAAASSFGMFIATFSKSAKQADGLATILILPWPPWGVVGFLCK